MLNLAVRKISWQALKGLFIYSIARVMVQAGIRRPFTAVAWVRSQACPWWIRGGKSGSGTGFSSTTSPCPVSIILSVLRGHSYTTSDSYWDFLMVGLWLGLYYILLLLLLLLLVFSPWAGLDRVRRLVWLWYA